MIFIIFEYNWEFGWLLLLSQGLSRHHLMYIGDKSAQQATNKGHSSSADGLFVQTFYFFEYIAAV